MKELIIKGIELGIFRHTNGAGYVKKVTDIDQIFWQLSKSTVMNENILRNYVNAHIYLTENKMDKYLDTFISFTNSRTEEARKVYPFNKTFLRGGIVTPTNINQAQLFIQPYSISHYNDCFCNKAFPENVHIYTGSPLVRA